MFEDSQESEANLIPAARAGDAEAMYQLGLILEDQGKLGESAKWLKEASASGKADATFHIARYLHEHAREDLPQNWFEKAEEQGSQEAKDYPRSRHFDASGSLIVEALSDEEIVSIREEIQTYISVKLEKWELEYGPLTFLELSKLALKNKNPS